MINVKTAWGKFLDRLKADINLELQELYSPAEQYLNAILPFPELVMDKAGRRKLLMSFTKHLATADGQLSPNLIANMVNAAELSHLGYLSIPDDVFKKARALTPDEVKAVRNHPQAFMRPLQGYPDFYGSPGLLWPFSANDKDHSIPKIVLHHHERWDGQGYPHGLKGNNSLGFSVSGGG